MSERLIIGLTNHTLLITKDGKEIPISDSGAPIRNREDQIIGVVLVFRDQSEERAKLQSIQESEQKYRLLITKMQQGLALHEVICDENNKVIDYRFLEINDGFEKLTGLKSNEIIGRTVLEVLPKTENYWIEKYGHVALTGEPLHYENYSKELNRYYEVVAYSPQYKQFAVIISDVTEARVLLKQIIESKEKIEQSEKLKSEFLAQMSHEIRSPINIIVNYLELLKTDVFHKLNEEQRSYFSSIDSANKRVIRTIDSILNMSELHLGIYEVLKKEIDIVNLIKNLRKEYISSAFSRNLEINFFTEINELNINVDEYAMNQTFANLIDNAIKYTHQGTIDINLKKLDDNFVLVEIIDTGIGISDDYMPYIFTPFSQEEHGYSRRFEGNGLGLALVKKYCDINGVRVSVESKKGKGTKFSMIIPISEH